MWPLKIVGLGLLLTLLVPNELVKLPFSGCQNGVKVEAYVLTAPVSSSTTATTATATGEVGQENREKLSSEQDDGGFVSKLFDPIESESITNSISSNLAGIIDNGEIDDYSPEIWTENNENDIREPAASVQVSTDTIFNPSVVRSPNSLAGAGAGAVETVGNFLNNIGNRISQHRGHVNRTLGNLNVGIEAGANVLQGFITNFKERKLRAFQSVVQRIANFFQTAITNIRGVFEIIQTGFQLLLGSIFNRRPSSPLSAGPAGAPIVESIRTTARVDDPPVTVGTSLGTESSSSLNNIELDF